MVGVFVVYAMFGASSPGALPVGIKYVAPGMIRRGQQERGAEWWKEGTGSLVCSPTRPRQLIVETKEVSLRYAR